MGPLAQQLAQRLKRILARERAGQPFRLISLDPGWVRSTVLNAIESKELSAKELKRAFDPSLLHRQWTERDRDFVFAGELAWRLQETLEARDEAEILRYVAQGVAARIGRPFDIGSATRNLELAKIADDAWSTTQHGTSIWEYALEIRAARLVSGHINVTPIGRVYADLTGRDALRWLLMVELEQSTGQSDRWRLSRDAAELLVKYPSAHWDVDEPGAPEMPFGPRRHLEELGLLSHWSSPDDFHHGYDLTKTGLELLTEVLTDAEETTIRALAKTLVAGETISSLPQQGGVAPPRDIGAIVAARQARAVAHELRNALVPAQAAYGSLSNAMRAAGSAELLDQFGRRVERGFARAFSYVENLLRISEAASQPPAIFRVVPAVRDAVAEVNGGSVTMRTVLSEEVTFLGYRDRFVMALVNLLRNAKEAGASKIEVNLRSDREDIVLEVDDDGPGVAPEHRSDIFKQGFSLRSGGTGYGLALVREIVQDDHQGAVACTTSPLGGARFTIRLPAQEVRA